MYEMDHILNCGYEIKWNYDAWKIQDFKGIWTRDLGIPVRRSTQLSYEATDFESWSFVGCNVPLRDLKSRKLEITFVRCGELWSKPTPIFVYTKMILLR